MSSLFDEAYIEELRKSAETVLDFTGRKAKSAIDVASDKYKALDEDTRKAITVGVCVFAAVIAIAGIFYLLGKRSGRRECEFEYEEWDG